MSGELRVDPVSGRTVVIAPARGRRPGAARPALEPPSADELESCPFCEGREDRTPPETLALPDGARQPDSPGWGVRVVPNLYPALERQEVVVHVPRHARSLAELSDGELELVAGAWRRRRTEEPHGYLHALVNEGKEAGASLAHSHSQLVWLKGPPPAVRAERELERLLEGEEVLRRDGVAAVCPWASRAPYELRIAPVEPEADAFESPHLAAALQLLAECIRRLQAVEGARPWNAWLHTGVRWHVEVLPRLTVLAGLELGAGIYLNPLAPEEAAERLRARAVGPERG